MKQKHLTRGCQLKRSNWSKWLKSIEVDRSDWSNQSKSIEVIVQSIEVNQSSKKCKSLIVFDLLRSTTINFNRLRLPSIDCDWYCYLQDNRLTTSNYKNPSCWLLWIHHASSFVYFTYIESRLSFFQAPLLKFWSWNLPTRAQNPRAKN